ncbi:hypothetical protein PMIN03_007998 [Paraphaeosphaeria minitans]
MPFPENKRRYTNALTRSSLPSPLQPRKMALVLGRNRWGKPRDSLGNEAYSYQRFLARQREAMSGSGGGMYMNNYWNTFGRGGLGGLRAPRMRRPAYGGGYYGGNTGYPGYGGYNQRPYTSRPRFAARPTQFTRPNPRYPSWRPFNYGGRLGRTRQQFQPRYRNYSPSPYSNRRRPYGRDQYYDDDLSEDDFDESDFEDSYYPSRQPRWYNGYRGWDDGDEDDEDDDEDEWDEYGYGDLDEEDDSDLDDYDYDSDGYDEGRYGYRGIRFHPRGYR